MTTESTICGEQYFHPMFGNLAPRWATCQLPPGHDDWHQDGEARWNNSPGTAERGRRRIARAELVRDVIAWLRRVWAENLAPAEAARQCTLLHALLGLESRIDRERGCCHEPDQIEAGECGQHTNHFLTALKALASAYADRPGYRDEWRPPA